MAPAAARGPRRRGATQPGPWADFGAGLASRRRELGMTQRDVAELAEVSVSTVQSLEAGRGALTVDSVAGVLAVLGLALVALPVAEVPEDLAVRAIVPVAVPIEPGGPR